MQKLAAEGFPGLRRAVNYARRKQGAAQLKRVLADARPQFEHDPRYWQLVGRIGREVGDEALVAEAAERGARLPVADSVAGSGAGLSPSARFTMLRTAAAQGQDALAQLIRSWLVARRTGWGDEAYGEAFRRLGEGHKQLALDVAEAWRESDPSSLRARAAVAKLLIKGSIPGAGFTELTISDQEVAEGNPSFVANLLVLLGMLSCRDRNMARAITPQLNRQYQAAGLAVCESAKGLDLVFGPSSGNDAPEADALVSIIMTAYNASQYIERSIRSLLNQSHRAFELIVVDDSSTDDTAAIVQRMAAEDPRIIFRSTPRNRRQYWSRNHALEIARGKYIAIQDADDIAHPDRLREQVRLLQRDDLVACYVATIRVDDKFWVKKLKTYGPIHKALASLMYKREQVGGKLGHFDEVRTTGDQEFHERMQTVFGDRAIGFVGYPLYFLRSHKASVTQSLKGHQNRAIGGIAEDYKKAFRAWHLAIASGQASPYIASHPTVRPFEAPGDVLAL